MFHLKHFGPIVAPISLPGGVLALHPAVRLEVGTGRVHTYLASRKRYTAVDGTIDQKTDPDGLRQFRGVQSQVYWFEKGSSGSPVFLQNGEQLAGIIALSELGANEGEGHLREAFVVPATTNRKYLERLRARLVATDQRTNPSELQNVMATKPLAAPYVDQADIASALTTAQGRLRQDDRRGALEVLRAMIAEVEKPSARRLIPLSRERAAI
jgi:hypothetical protein